MSSYERTLKTFHSSHFLYSHLQFVRACVGVIHTPQQLPYSLLKGNPSLLKSTSTLLFIVLKVITILVQSGRYEIHSRNRLPLLDFLHVNDPYLFELIEKAEKTYRELRYATLVNSDWVPELIVRALCLAKTFKSFSYN